PRVIILLKIKPHIRGLRVKINTKLPDALRLPVTKKRIKVNRAVFASSLFIFNCQPKLISAL
ncbi:hypothetical protein, partial [Escherichia coli]|uniref:hypothetical protein n=1 Tax=Escherichia coli TaxID=562 RepID=UPI0019D472E9